MVAGSSPGNRGSGSAVGTSTEDALKWMSPNERALFRPPPAASGSVTGGGSAAGAATTAGSGAAGAAAAGATTATGAFSGEPAAGVEENRPGGMLTIASTPICSSVSTISSTLGAGGAIAAAAAPAGSTVRRRPVKTNPADGAAGAEYDGAAGGSSTRSMLATGGAGSLSTISAGIV